MSLFVFGDFRSDSGLLLTWKINCDALTPDDWRTIAAVSAERLPGFGAVVGVPRGGLALAREMGQYATSGPTLVVGDVWTTGGSMRRAAASVGWPWLGLVAFAGRMLPPYVYAFMRSWS